MIAVIFEVWMKDGQTDRYFDLASSLRPRLQDVDGFVSVERFESVSTPNKFVSLSFWRDEAAVAAWRADSKHAMAQALGRDEIFADFRITVAETIRQYSLADRNDGGTD